jgi:hypothetical protein
MKTETELFSSPIAALDAKSISYLQAAEGSAGGKTPGWFVVRKVAFGKARDGWLTLLVLGIVALGVAIELIVVVAPGMREGDTPVVWQAVTAGIGVWFVGFGLAKFLRAAPPWEPRGFVFADSRFLWEVGPGKVQASDLSKLTSVAGTHHRVNNGYRDTRLTLQLAGRNKTLVLSDMTGATCPTRSTNGTATKPRP